MSNCDETNHRDVGLTDQKYWRVYYGSNVVDVETVVRICSQYDRFWESAISQIDDPACEVVEIGGFPGRYLAYLGWKYGLRPTSIDFNSNTHQIEGHFKAFGIKKYSIITEDFLNYEPDRSYDLVISNGFVEHFKDHDHVLNLHVNYLKPGGVLFVNIPNMKGLIKPYKIFLDRNNLSKHSLGCMEISVLRDFAARNGLQILHAGYFGDFPFSVHEELFGFKRLTQRVFRIVFKYGLNHLIRSYPNRYLSSSIVAMFKR